MGYLYAKQTTAESIHNLQFFHSFPSGTNIMEFYTMTSVMCLVTNIYELQGTTWLLTHINQHSHSSPWIISVLTLIPTSFLIDPLHLSHLPSKSFSCLSYTWSDLPLLTCQMTDLSLPSKPSDIQWYANTDIHDALWLLSRQDIPKEFTL